MAITTDISSDDILKMLFGGIEPMIAKKGLFQLRQVLTENGVLHDPILRDFSLDVTLDGHYMEFSIYTDLENFNDASKKRIYERRDHRVQVKQTDDMIRENVKRWVYRKDGTMGKLALMHDARRPSKDARTPARDARKTALDRNTVKTAPKRLAQHEFYDIRPRDLEMDENGKFSVKFDKQMKRVNQQHIYPRHQYGGMIKQFEEKIKNILIAELPSRLVEALQSTVTRG